MRVTPADVALLQEQDAQAGGRLPATLLLRAVGRRSEDRLDPARAVPGVERLQQGWPARVRLQGAAVSSPALRWPLRVRLACRTHLLQALQEALSHAAGAGLLGGAAGVPQRQGAQQAP